MTSQYVTEQLHPNTENPKPLAQLIFDTDGLPSLEDVNLENLVEAVYSLPVPKDFQSLKAQNQEKAMQWRFATRDAFEKLFAAGYAAVRLEQQELCNHYIFVKKHLYHWRKRIMKITEITIRHLQMDLKAPFTTSFGTFTKRISYYLKQRTRQAQLAGANLSHFIHLGTTRKH